MWARDTNDEVMRSGNAISVMNEAGMKGDVSDVPKW